MPTLAGFLYLAIVLDAWSRRIVGWSMANHLGTELVLDAFDMTLGQRRPPAAASSSHRPVHPQHHDQAGMDGLAGSEPPKVPRVLGDDEPRATVER